MELETQRLILREFRDDDESVVLAYQSNPRYMRYYPIIGRTFEEVRDFIQMFLEQQQVVPRIKYQLVVTLKANQKLIGNCGIRMDKPDSCQADIGFELSPEYWGKGYASEAVREIITFGFTKLGIHRIWAECIANNLRVVSVLDKLGMRLEGRLVEKVYFKECWWDTLIFALLETEWQNQTQAGNFMV
jgi:ribosomal-protein-alanine N-acetyltransferase